MAETTGREWPLPDQTTSPPDVPGWLRNLGQAVDDSFLWGPIAELPATLAPGQVYFGW